MKLTLGPILFHWPAEQWRAFYDRVADESCVDTVCVGEIVCSKRWPFIESLMPGVVERLLRAGKTVLLSTPIMPTLERERRMIEEFANTPGMIVEANDVSALPFLAGRPHAIGPSVNTYNEGSLRHFARNGAVLACLPPELPLGSIGPLAAVDGVAVEVWAFGRIPLAISARCYHARLHNRSKDSCQFVCGDDPDGRSVEDMTGKPFMAINGVQTLSGSYGNALGDIEQLSAAGVASLRLSPCSGDMIAVARLFREVIDGKVSAAEADRGLSELLPSASFSNGFLHARPGHQRVLAGRPAADLQALD